MPTSVLYPVSTPRLEQLLAFLAQDPTDPFVHYALALEYQRQGQPETAAQYFAGLVRNHPNYLATYYHYGKLLQAQGQTESAIDLFRAGIEVATEARDRNALRELNEALQLALGFDEDGF